MRIITLLFTSLLLLAQPGITPPVITPLHCPLSVTIGTCPVEGCGDVSDAFLNSAKNRVDTPNAPVAMTVKAIKALKQPADWVTGKDRGSVQGTGKEGAPVLVMGFLSIARAEGAESCNCELKGAADTDIHLVIVEPKTDPETASITAEMTPRLRSQHSSWTASNVNNNLQGKFVRLTGWLMLDTAHLKHSNLVTVQDGGSSVTEHKRGPLKRATNWEVHPVTKIEVCNSTVANCRAGQGWAAF